MQITVFQEQGVTHLCNPYTEGKKHSSYLADDCGLGKTVQVAVGIKRLKAKAGLIVCKAPLPVKEHWVRHLIEWADIDEKDIYIVQNTTDDIPKSAKWIIVSYEQLIASFVNAQLLTRRYALLIIDEAQSVKNVKSRRTKRLIGDKGNNLAARAHYTWFLSAQPVENRPIEWFPVLAARCPKLLNDILDVHCDLKFLDADNFVRFGFTFCNGYEYEWGGHNFNGASKTDILRDALFESGFLLKRTIDEVEKDIPPVLESKHYFYVKMLEDETNTRASTLQRLIGEAKLPGVLEHLRYELSYGKKLVVVAYHTNVIEGLVDGLSQYNPVFISGGVTSAQKKDALDKFINDPKCLPLIVQINAGGTSIDGLQRVCHNMFFVEPNWSDGTWQQMLGRLRRLGQDKPVHAIVAIARGTLDEVVYGVKNAKNVVINNLMTPKEKTMLEEKIDKVIKLLEEANTYQVRIAVALEAGNPVTTTNGSGKTTAAKAKAPAKPKKPKVTEDECRQVANIAIAALVENGGKSQEDATQMILDLVQEVSGAEKLADAKPAHFADIKEAFEKVAEENQEKQSAASLI